MPTSHSNLDHVNPIEDFACKFPRVKFSAGAKLFARGSQPQYFFYVIEGSVKLSQTAENGQVVNLHVFYPGSCISLLSLTGPSDSYDFEAATALEVYQIPREEFLAEARKDAVLTFELLLHAMRGMKGLLHRIQLNASEPAIQRVSGLLVYFAKHQPLSTVEKGVIPVEVTHQEIADWLGLTRENVSLQLKSIEDQGLIKRRQRLIEVLNVPGLLKLSRQ